jgi:hypothetical protein
VSVCSDILMHFVISSTASENIKHGHHIGLSRSTFYEGVYEVWMYAIVVFTCILLHTCQKRQIHRSQFLTANIKMTVLWDVTSYSLVDISKISLENHTKSTINTVWQFCACEEK